MKWHVHASKLTLASFLGTLSILLAVLWVIVGLLLFTGCDSVDPQDNDDGDIWVLDDDFVARASFSYEVALAQHTRIRLDAINGPVEIHGDPEATTVAVAGQRRVGSDSMQDAEQHLDDLEVQVDDLTDEVFIKTVQPQQSQGRQYVVEYTITVPEHLDVEVDHVNGEIKVRDVAGSVWVDLTNGVIDYFSTLPLPVKGRHAVHHGACYGQHLLDGCLLPPDTVDLTLVNGNIKLRIPTSTSAEFSALVTNGRINTSNLVLEDLVRSPHSMTGRLGDGEGTIDLAVVNGTITVTGH